MLRPVRELVVLSQATLPHKRFILALVLRQLGIYVSIELDFSLCM